MDHRSRLLRNPTPGCMRMEMVQTSRAFGTNGTRSTSAYCSADGGNLNEPEHALRALCCRAMLLLLELELPLPRQ
jgi:hypothetical protein